MNLARPGRRAALSFLLATALAGFVAVPADAANAREPARIEAEYWSVDCVYALTGGDTLFLFASGTTDGAEGGVGAFVEDANGVLVAEGHTDRFAFADSFSTSFQLGDSPLVVEAGLEPGLTTTSQVRERSGNSWTTGTTTTTPLEVLTRTLTYAGAVVELSGGSCNGEITGFDVRTTTPSASVYRDRDFDSDICDVVGIPNAQARVTGALPETFVEVVVDAGPDSVEKLAGNLAVHGGHGSMTADVVDLFTGEVTTTSTVSLALTKTGQRARQVETSSGIVERRTYTTYRENLTIRFADGRHGTATCTGMATVSHVWVGPNPEE